MYVCLCRGVTQKHIRREVMNGAVTYDEIQDRLEVGMCCGTCKDTTLEVIDNTLQQSLLTKSLVAESSACEANVIQLWTPTRRAG